jgi:DNA modification methylase
MSSIELICGDCLEKMKDIPNNSIDMVLCDLPYGVLSLKWDCVLPMDALWLHYERILKSNGAVLLFGTEPFSSYLRMGNINWYKYDYIWVKTKAGNFSSCRKIPMKYHENISVFYKDYPTYNMPNLHTIEPVKSGRKNKGSNAQQASNGDINYIQTESGFNESVLYYSNKSGKGYSFHPTQKPIELLEYLIKIYTNEGMAVLDNTMGSGSTMVACVNTNRNGIGIELDEKYYNIACQRVKQAENEKETTLF